MPSTDGAGSSPAAQHPNKTEAKMNHYAEAIEIIARLDRKITNAELHIAKKHPKIFVDAMGGSYKYDLILTDCGEKKIGCIKLVREVTGLGLKEAKELSDATPSAITEGATKEYVENIASRFAELGARTSIRKA
jgi:ribosomal protein L7/L12